MNRLRQLSLEELAQRCAAETERFFRQVGGHENAFCFELFRRAFVDRSDAAWSKLYTQYQSLVTGWIHEHPQFAVANEEPDYFVNGVFSSMWKACTPERFPNFPDLPALLAYLKSCVHTTIINHTRKRRPPLAQISEELVGEPRAQPIDPMAGAVLNQLARAELWHLLDGLLHNDKERLVTELYFIQGMKPRLIYEQNADRFATVQEVYRVKQNLMERLSRNTDLQQFYVDLRENR